MPLCCQWTTFNPWQPWRTETDLLFVFDVAPLSCHFPFKDKTVVYAKAPDHWGGCHTFHCSMAALALIVGACVVHLLWSGVLNTFCVGFQIKKFVWEEWTACLMQWNSQLTPEQQWNTVTLPIIIILNLIEPIGQNQIYVNFPLFATATIVAKGEKRNTSSSI